MTILMTGCRYTLCSSCGMVVRIFVCMLGLSYGFLFGACGRQFVYIGLVQFVCMPDFFLVRSVSLIFFGSLQYGASLSLFCC
jgi:hypothetical protein